MIEQLIDDGFHGHAFGLGPVTGENPVSHHRVGQRTDVLKIDVRSSGKQMRELWHRGSGSGRLANRLPN